MPEVNEVLYSLTLGGIAFGGVLAVGKFFFASKSKFDIMDERQRGFIESTNNAITRIDSGVKRIHARLDEMK